MQIVKAIEAVGTQSGKPKKRVTIVDCGELPSKRMILKRLREEKEELANLKKDPIAVSASMLISHSANAGVNRMPFLGALAAFQRNETIVGGRDRGEAGQDCISRLGIWHFMRCLSDTLLCAWIAGKF